MQSLKNLNEIDETLDQLIRNAEAISNADFKSLTEIELEAFKKTQESLLNHLLIIDSLQDKRSASERVFQKRQHFEKLRTDYSKELEALDRKPIICKRRKKKFFHL